MKRSLALLGLLSLTMLSCSKSDKGPSSNPTPPQEATATAAKVVVGNESTQSFLERFYQDPTKVMDETPVKTNKKGVVVNPSPFTIKEIESSDFIAKKDLLRASLMGAKAISSRAAIAEDTEDESGSLVSDKVENLVDNGGRSIRDLETMETSKLMSAKLPVQPWSDDYWAIRNGILGFRYADAKMPTEGTWKDLFDFTQTSTPENYIHDGKVDLLSPSEKYDLLVGDQNGELTKGMWDEGRYYFEKSGDVESWMGICHGWAPAAYMLPRPVKALKLKSADGQTDITFFPSDIKALGSLLWAKGASSTKFIGRRCNQKKPKKDHAGRILDQSCFDTNPGTWHMAVVNQIGVVKRGMVIDATFDYEVWNQPMLSYSYKYFNPETSAVSDTLAGAAIPVKDFSRDPFHSYRSPLAERVVGIEMNIEYMVETSPSQELVNDPENDGVQQVTYRYDLELDQNGQIIGGEWYTNAHPDFLWTPVRGGKAGSRFESMVHGNWNALEKPVLFQDWAQLGRLAGKEGMPLGRIIESLFKASSAARVSQ